MYGIFIPRDNQWLYIETNIHPLKRMVLNHQPVIHYIYMPTCHNIARIPTNRSNAYQQQQELLRQQHQAARHNVYETIQFDLNEQYPITLSISHHLVTGIETSK
jgi:hypothetical protein